MAMKMRQLGKFATKYEKDRWKRDLDIYNEFEKLTRDPKSSKTEVTKYLMEKHNLHSASSVWYIRNRVEKALREG